MKDPKSPATQDWHTYELSENVGSPTVSLAYKEYLMVGPMPSNSWPTKNKLSIFINPLSHIALFGHFIVPLVFCLNIMFSNFVCLCGLFCCVCLVFFSFNYVVYFPKTERKGMKLDGKAGGKNLIGDEGEESMIRIYL